MPSTWLNLNDVADHFGLSKKTVYRIIRDGVIPAYKFNGSDAIQAHWYFKREDVENLMQPVTKGSEANDE